MVKEKFALYLQCKEKILRQFSALQSQLKDSRLIQWINKHKDNIALILNTLLLAGCGYWVYQLIIIDVSPHNNWSIGISDSRDALALLFFGMYGFVFVLFFVWFIIKFIYNLFHDGIQSLFPVQWYSLTKPITYLMILCVAFSFTGNIKTAGLTAYSEVAALFHTSKQHAMVIERDDPESTGRKISKLLNLIGNKEKE